MIIGNRISSEGFRLDDPVKKYSRPPIVEAVIEIRLDGQTDVNEQESVVDGLRKLYPKSETLQKLDVHIDATARNINIAQADQGFRLETADQADVVLVHPNSIAVVRLPPYLGWEQLRERSEAVWKIWKRETTFRRIVRLGVRYVNRIDIPGEGSIDIEKYFGFHPNIPEQVNTEITAYLVQVTLVSSIPNWIARITTTPTASPLIDHNSFILDIDVFRTEDIPQRSEDLWRITEEARRVKNEMFENCITDSTRALFGK